ncbi:MAG TPA: hypothetical protein VGB83_09710, partial [Actinomycetota bacterium]
SYVSDEEVVVKSRDGGALWGQSSVMYNYKKRPSLIEAGNFGSWVDYDPGNIRERSLLDSHVWFNGAQVSVNFPESYGSATFSAGMEVEDTTKATNTYTYRKLEFTDQPRTGFGTDKGLFYLYDMGTGWKEENLSCKFADGWFPDSSQGSDYCWKNNS